MNFFCHCVCDGVHSYYEQIEEQGMRSIHYIKVCTGSSSINLILLLKQEIIECG